MESNKYYGLGNDEYNIYKTVDNGRSWEVLGTSHGGTNTVEGRIIIYSDSDKGLMYTDDGYVTIMNSNITDGSWKKVKILPDSDVIFAESLDGDGIYLSDNNGETWKFFMDGSADDIYKDGDSTIIQGEDSKIIIDEKGARFIPIGYGDDVYYVLNELLIPNLSIILTGHRDLNYFRQNVSLNFDSFFTDGDTFGVSNKDQIDFPADVGMRPLEAVNIDSDLASVLSVEDKEKLESELLNPDSALSYSFRIIDKYLDNYRTYYLDSEIKEVMNKKEDYEGLQDSQVESMKLFYDVYKGSVASIKGTIINSIFTFDNVKKLSLLKQSIINTAELQKGVINARLLSLKKVEGSTYTMDLEKMWTRALKESIEDYYYKCKRNINYITDDNDKKYISAASKKYREDREVLIDNAEKQVNSLRIIDDANFNNTLRDIKSLLGRFIKDCQKIVDAFNSSTGATFNEGFPQEKNGAFRSGENPLSATIPEPRGQNIYADQLADLLGKYIEEADMLYSVYPNFGTALLLESYTIKFKELLDNNLRNVDTRECFYFTPLEYDEYLSDMVQWEIEKVNKYHTDILLEFRKRVMQLFRIAGQEACELLYPYMDVRNNMEEFVSSILKEMGTSIYIDFNKFNMDDAYRELDETNGMILRLTQSGWKNLKENI